MATAEEKTDPYIPMDAALAQPAPEAEPPAPIHVGPVTLGSLFGAWGRVLKKHFWWGVVLMVLPTLASNAQVILTLLGISAPSAQTLGTAVLFFLAAPLQLGSTGGLIWRLVGSGAHGPLRREPIEALFWGFRFAGVQFAYGLLLGLVCLPLAIPSVIIYFAALAGESGMPVPPSQEPTGWVVFAAVSLTALALAVYLTARWAIGAEIAVARNVELSSALKQSSARVKPRMRTVFVFVGIKLLVTTILVTALSWSGALLFNLGLGSPYVAAACSIASVLVSIIAAVVGPAANAALYFALTPGEQGGAQKAAGDPTDPTDPTDRSDPQEVLA